MTAAELQPTVAGSAQVASLCVTCHLRPGRPRPTVLRTVVCGPCWAGHLGSPAAEEIGPEPMFTVPSWEPRDQRHWLRALRRQDWVQEIRADGQDNLLRMVRELALCADWDTLDTRPTVERLIVKTGLSERTVYRWLQELRVRGWLAHLEPGSTPATRPMALAHLDGNRAAVYGLRIPLSPDEAVRLAAETLARQVAEQLAAEAAQRTVDAEKALAQVRALLAKASSTAFACEAEALTVKARELMAQHDIAQDLVDARDSAESLSDRPVRRFAVDINGSPSWPFGSCQRAWVGGSSRARRVVDDLRMPATDPGVENDQIDALRARFDQRGSPDWAITVPSTGFQMLAAASWLQRHVPIFRRLTRKAVRAACRPYWSVGWTNRDIVHAMDHRPSIFSQQPGVLLASLPVAEIASPALWIKSRLGAWRTPDGAILPSHRSRTLDEQAATRRVQVRHGRAGRRLLRDGDLVLTAERVAEHGRQAAADLAAERQANQQITGYPTPRPPRRPASSPAAAAVAEDAAAVRDRRRAEQTELMARLAEPLAAARAELAGRTAPDPAAFTDPALLAELDALTSDQRRERALAVAHYQRRHAACRWPQRH